MGTPLNIELFWTKETPTKAGSYRHRGERFGIFSWETQVELVRVKHRGKMQLVARYPQSGATVWPEQMGGEWYGPIQKG